MGLLFSRFRRKQTTSEILEDIDKEIKFLQRNRKVNQERQKQFVTSLLIYSIAAYIIAAVVFFCVYFPDTWQLRLIYSLPLLIFPVLVWGLKKTLHWYFVNRISSNDTALQDLSDRKSQILEDVMETETYKKAREILEKYDPERLRKLEGIPEAVPPDMMGTPGTVIQQRTFRTPVQAPIRMSCQQPPRPGPSSVIQRQNGSPYPSSPVSNQEISASMPIAVLPVEAAMGGSYIPALRPRPPMPRSILPRERGTMDRLMDYLVGDGPENRYALICWQCFSHNGMALKEEFEYLSFRCCYCYTINPARKQRPTAPRLEFFAPPGLKRPRVSDDSAASSEESGCSDVDKQDDISGGGSDRNSSKSDTPNKFKGVSPIKSHQPASMSAPFSTPQLDLNNAATASTMDHSKELMETKGRKLEFVKVLKLDDPDGIRPKSHDPDGIRPKSHDPDGIRPKSHDPDGIRPKSHDPDGIRPKSHDHDYQGQKSHEPDDQRLKSHDLDDQGPKSHDQDNQRPKSFDLDDHGPKSHEPDDQGPKSHDHDDQRPKSNDHHDLRPKSHDHDDQRPKSHDFNDHGPKSHDPDEQGLKPHDPDDQEPKPHDPDDQGPKPHDLDEQGPKSQVTDDQNPKSHDFEGQGRTLHETKSKRLTAEDIEPTIQPPVGLESLFSEVSTLEHQVTQQLEDPSYSYLSMEPSTEDPHFPELEEGQNLTVSSDNLRSAPDFDPDTVSAHPIVSFNSALSDLTHPGNLFVDGSNDEEYKDSKSNVNIVSEGQCEVSP